ncbi:MAG: hypothetical protein A2751_04425 [Candidatus Doudnabacteria bacterium RIFCSPHIGHO2_01_FULL_46_14]|uniref:Uncharacterized protein n=1 Tax=Candidatus Doudnabacteria bacterium RIFCSPHIGHO2_01_FULL_46_14 TaxID=1817824 RepID=A0A1F5NPB1_9BACT|nr:MAG: hypothetical protein A2751_04425 [Candidatus Doudnabacteria bacterium RIFCSPHIGHO2_01_FULL_46_14]
MKEKDSNTFADWLSQLPELNGASFSTHPARAFALAFKRRVDLHDQEFRQFIADWNRHFSRTRRKLESITEPGFYRLRINSKKGESLDQFHPQLKRHAYNSQVTARSVELIVWMRMTDHGLYLQEVSPLPEGKSLQVQWRAGFWALVQEPFVFQLDAGWKSAPFLRACRFIETESMLYWDSCLPALSWIFAAGVYDVIKTADDALHNKLNFPQARKLVRAACV